jgi:hypothetical protein
VNILVFRRFEEFFSAALEFAIEEGTALELFWEVLFDHWVNLLVCWFGALCLRVGAPTGDVCNEGTELVGDRNWWKHLACGGIYAAGGAVCRAVLARDISGEDCAFGFVSGKVYALENFVAGFASAAACPPPFNDSAIVSVYLKINAGGTCPDD